MFVLRRGNDEVINQEYSYGRRAQSTVRSLRWRDVAAIDTDCVDTAVSEASAAIEEWASRGYTAEKWALEGRGGQCRIQMELSSTGWAPTLS